MRDALIVDNISDLIGNTPLIRLNKITKGKSCAEILAKAEFLNPGGSVKDRPCLAMIRDAEEKGVLKKGTTVVEPTTGNTGIGLAMICAEKGYHCILTMPEDLSLERTYLLRAYGAEVVLTPASKGIQGAIDKAIKIYSDLKEGFMPLQFKSKLNPASHRQTTAKEILKATGGRIDAFITGVGTGGTLTGVAEVLSQEIEGIKIFAVEPKASAVLSGRSPGRHKIQGIGAGFIPEILNREIIDEIIEMDDVTAFNMARRLGETMGLCVGISSGANVAAALILAERFGEGKTIVTFLCDTGERYFSTEQYFSA